MIQFSSIENLTNSSKSWTLPISFLKDKPLVSPQITAEYRYNMLEYNMKKSNIFCNIYLKYHIIVSWDFNKIRSEHLLEHHVLSWYKHYKHKAPFSHFSPCSLVGDWGSQAVTARSGGFSVVGTKLSVHLLTSWLWLKREWDVGAAVPVGISATRPIGTDATGPAVVGASGQQVPRFGLVHWAGINLDGKITYIRLFQHIITYIS